MDIAGWEKMYSAGERGAEESPTRLLVEIAPKLKPGVAIDLACGTGRHALYLAKLGWDVTAIDGSETAIRILQERAAEHALSIKTEVADLASPTFQLAETQFDLVVIAYYLQRDLLARLRPALRPGGVVVAIVHTPDPGEPPTYKRAAPGELRSFFQGWNIWHDYEGPSRDPAHRRPVAEIVAQLL